MVFLFLWLYLSAKARALDEPQTVTKTNSVFLNMHKDKQPMHCIILRESFSTLCAMKHRWPIKLGKNSENWVKGDRSSFILRFETHFKTSVSCVLNIFLNQQALNIVLLSSTFFIPTSFHGVKACGHFCHKPGLFTDHITSLTKRLSDPVHIVI